MQTRLCLVAVSTCPLHVFFRALVLVIDMTVILFNDGDFKRCPVKKVLPAVYIYNL